MMGKSLRDIQPFKNHTFFDEPFPLEQTKNQSVSSIRYLFEKHGIPTPISGDPIASR